MSTPKYTLIDEGRKDKLLRLRALRGFGGVEAGELGGLVAGEHNLSHEGDCWVYGDARVYGNAHVLGGAKVSGSACVFGGARVRGDAKIYGSARVYGTAWIYGDARIYGNAKVSGDAQVYGNAQVSGDAHICGNAQVYVNAQVSGRARVYGDAHVYDNARICGRAKLSSISDYICVGPIGSRNAYTTFWMQAGMLHAATGCFCGTAEELLVCAAARDCLNSGVWLRQYEAAVLFARSVIATTKNN